jgi:N6-adenosine-specific RNA methylase IME4
MSIEQIQNIELPTTDNSVLFLWTTHAFLPHSFELLKNWGFTYKATMVWNKQKIGMGAWFRMQCEFCLVGIKGKPIWQNTTYSELINESRREHSRKPEAFFDLVNKICFGRKLEYFSREARDGWDIYGNDINKYNGL